MRSVKMYVYSIQQALRMLDLFGCHPEKHGSLQVVQFVVSMGGYIVIITMSILLLFYHQTSMQIEILSDVFVTSSAFFIGMGKIVMIFTNKNALSNILQKMEYKFWKIEDVVDREEKMSYEKILTNMRFVLHLYIVIFSCWTAGIINFRDLPVKSYVFHLGVPHFLLIIIQNIYCCAFPITVIAVDTLIMATLRMTLIQYKMLNAEISKVFDTGELREKTQRDVIIKDRIKRLVDHHNFLFQYTDLINESYSMNILVYIAQMVILLCFTMYHISMMHALDMTFFRDLIGVILTFYTFGYHYCVAAQDCVDESKNVKMSAYLTEWYNYPEHADGILMIMTRDQLNVEISAGGVAKLDLETCLSDGDFALDYMNGIMEKKLPDFSRIVCVV